MPPPYWERWRIILHGLLEEGNQKGSIQCSIYIHWVNFLNFIIQVFMS